MSDNLYQEELMDHFRHPRNKKKIEHPDFKSGHYNPSCGDRVSIEGKIDKRSGRIVELGFDGSGCVISQATASMLTEMCIGKTVEQVLAITKDDIINLIRIELGPTRLRCALLCLQALQDGLKEYKGQK